MATLYVTEAGTQLKKEYNRLRVINREGQTILVTPLSRVSEVVLIGRIGLTTPALMALLDAEISLTFLTRQGKLRGRLTPPVGKNVPLRRQQYDRANQPAFQLALSRALVRGKLRNSRTMARRMIRSGANPPAGQLARLLEALAESTHSPDSASLMGQEGQGAKAYYAILRATLKPSLPFGARSRRPPKDPINAMLSLGYSLLTANLMTALEIVGLDPYCGFFHSNVYGRPALALDLMEEFRPIVVDSVVLTMVNKGMLTERDFEPGKYGGVYLRRQGLRGFFKEYTRRLNTTIHHPMAGRRLSYQKIFEVQARQLAKLIEGKIDSYRPFLIR